MARALVVINGQFDRRRAAEWCMKAKPGTRIEFKAPKRSLDQNAKLWASLTDVAVQVREWGGIKLSPDDWKLIFLDALKRETGGSLRLVPNTDHTGIVNLSTSSSDLSKEEMSELIEIILKFGAERGVIFNDTNPPELAGGGSELASPETSLSLPNNQGDA